MLAAGALVLVDQRAAVAAADAVPLFQADVGARRVVGLEDLTHEEEEVEQSPLLQGAANGRAALALAELVVLDVRMRGIAAANLKRRSTVPVSTPLSCFITTRGISMQR